MSVRFISYLCSRNENKMGNSKIKSSLVKTDYDNFKDMRFFVEQQRKAQEMIREVDEFTHSFLDSKLMSVEDVMSDYHNWLTFSSGQKMERIFKAYIEALCEYPLFVKEYQQNNKMSDNSYGDTKEYISQHIDYNEPTFRHYIESFIDEYNSNSNVSTTWTILEKERPVWHRDYRNPWNDRIIRYEQYNPFGEFKHRYWDIITTSPIIRWIEYSMWGGGTEYGEHLVRLGWKDTMGPEELKDAYDKHPSIKIYKSGNIKFIRGTVNQDIAIKRVLKEYRKEFDEVHKKVLKYGMRVPNEKYIAMLGSDRAEAFKEHNLVFNPHTVKSIVDYKNQRLIPFMDEDTKVNIEILDKVLRCTAIRKHQTEALRYFKDYDTHFIRKVVIDFDLNTNELVNASEEDINDKDIIWKENI